MKNSIISVSLILFFAGCHNVQVKEVVTVPKALVEAVRKASEQSALKDTTYSKVGIIQINASSTCINSLFTTSILIK